MTSQNFIDSLFSLSGKNAIVTGGNSGLENPLQQL